MNKKLKDILLQLALALTLFLAVEATLRFFSDAPSSKRTESVAYQFDEEFLVALKPNMEKLFIRSEVNGGDTVRWQTNEDGFRGGPLRKDASLRIMVYGDSNIQARFSKLENTFAYRLQQSLQQRLAKKVEVINAGVIGFGPDQVLKRFGPEAERYAFDLGIVHITSENDFGDIIRNRLYELDDNQKLKETPFKVTPDEYLTREDSQQNFLSSLLVVKRVRDFIHRMKGEEEVDRKSVDFHLSWAEREFDVYKKSEPRQFSHFADHYDMDLALFPESKSALAKKELMGQVLHELKSVAQSNGVQLLISIQPSVLDICDNYSSADIKFDAYPGYRKTNLTSFVEKICIENDIPYVNLYESFERNEPEHLYFKGFDPHWNDAGQDLAAEVISNYIVQNLLSEKEA